MAKKASQHQSGTAALRVLDSAKIPYTLYEYEHSSTMAKGYALDTATVLDVDPETVFKTLMVEVDGRPAVGVVPASGQLNLKSIARALGAKSAKMMDRAKAERLTGYVAGGISPLGQRSLYPTVIDNSAQVREAMLVSGGKRSLSVKLSAADLAKVTGAFFAPISTDS